MARRYKKIKNIQENKIIQETVLEKDNFLYRIQEKKFQLKEEIDNGSKKGWTWDKKAREEHSYNHAVREDLTVTHHAGKHNWVLG